ncbi:hypothetical protein M9H77_06876 [Catharanthus roseus]|uniref:Uncharacterized protein n=1 Tax=Catharanthus roseus TaxID=4058 RepID=A0ACC0BTJ9_CATRO|nr:hypothetical protein M9H77_06876 [Catharanthus roseus]
MEGRTVPSRVGFCLPMPVLPRNLLAKVGQPTSRSRLAVSLSTALFLSFSLCFHFNSSFSHLEGTFTMSTDGHLPTRSHQEGTSDPTRMNFNETLRSMQQSFEGLAGQFQGEDSRKNLFNVGVDDMNWDDQEPNELIHRLNTRTRAKKFKGI